ncbi:MAG: anthranilate synthase component I [Armatimonadota bacterium]
MPKYQPSLEEFRERAKQGDLVPVYRELLADLETPVSAFMKLKAAGNGFAFLLESVTGGEHVARYSYMGAAPRRLLTSRGQLVTITEGGVERQVRLEQGQDPLHLLKELMQARQYVPLADWERFSGGAVGFMSYDMVRFFEQLPDQTEDDLQLPDCMFMIADEVVIFDHVQHKMRVLVNTVVEGDPDEAYRQALERMESIVATLAGPLPAVQAGPVAASEEIASNFAKEDFEDAVRKAKEYIAAGDCIQVVLAQRLGKRIAVDPFTIYRALRSVNPSPYMYYLSFDDLKIVGASPEILVTEDAGKVVTRPIAGTRRRGKTREEDLALEQELLADEKERAEHIMLVDLHRNDIGRVCVYGTVQVDELMVVERYSHVMHIVTNVVGELAPGKDQFDVLRACFPAGTVSGAPKIRAMEIIDELEPTRRGPYAGAIGYFSYSGSMDTAITIRTLVVQGNMAYVGVGAGIVADSRPEREHEETMEKAGALLRAIALAEEGLA